MNDHAHENILVAAVDGLPAALWSPLAAWRELLPRAANYPDLFDNPFRSDAEKAADDPDWRRYTRLPSHLGGSTIHDWPYPIDEQMAHRPLMAHLLHEATTALGAGDTGAFVKFIGCLSHYLGDICQPMHLIDELLLAQLLPAPEHLRGFRYHAGIEAVTGICGPLRAPRLLGASVEELVWHLAAANITAIAACRAYVVPTVQAVFAGAYTEAKRLAAFPVSQAAELTLDALYTALCIARGQLATQELDSLREVDLNVVHTEAEEANGYGGAIEDGSRQLMTPDQAAIPARLRLADGTVRSIRGLGVLPGPATGRPAGTRMRIGLPAGVFDRFEALLGLHADLAGEGAVEFRVSLDDREVFRSGRLTSAEAAQRIAIPLGGAATIMLQVEDATLDGWWWHDHAIWGEPRLLRATAARS